MEVKINNQQDMPARGGPSSVQIKKRYLPVPIDLLITAGLIIVALIPRVILAQQLDVVTDEIVYIFGGKSDFHLLTHLLIGDNGWNYNYEHPPLVKFLIGFTIYLNSHCASLLNELQAARGPSILSGILLIVALYCLGRAPFGRSVALAASLCLACSPWLVYFSALAYLDMTMTVLVTIAYLLLWPAIRRPQLYLLIAGLVALAVDSKYTAALAIPGMLLFTLYYFLALQPRLPQTQRVAIPWLWWLIALILCPLTFLAVDPAIWPHPISLLLHSFLYEWNHASDGHLTFLAGKTYLHMPQWTILYIIFTKVSVLVTLPALLFILFATIQLIRFHLPNSPLHYQQAAQYAFLLIWLLASLFMFSRLTIVVGTHYHLPVAPPLALAGAAGMAILLRFLTKTPGIFSLVLRYAYQFTLTGLPIATTRERDVHHDIAQQRFNCLQQTIASCILVAALALPHLSGLMTVYGAEGYTSEFFQGENTTLQVAYPGYRDALQWLALHTSNQSARIGLVGLENALGGGNYATSWYTYNRNLPARFQLTEAHPDDYNLSYDYLVWPMHLIQRGYTIPLAWRSHIVHIITGGNTTYCYILARNPATIT